jgi:hypothetical protein
MDTSPPAVLIFWDFRFGNSGSYSAEPPSILILQDIQIRVCVDFARKPDRVAVIFDEHLPRFTPLFMALPEGSAHAEYQWSFQSNPEPCKA